MKEGAVMGIFSGLFRSRDKCPESVIFTLHATYKFIRGYIPINLIGIRNEEGIDRFRGKT